MMIFNLIKRGQWCFLSLLLAQCAHLQIYAIIDPRAQKLALIAVAAEKGPSPLVSRKSYFALERFFKEQRTVAMRKLFSESLDHMESFFKLWLLTLLGVQKIFDADQWDDPTMVRVGTSQVPVNALVTNGNFDTQKVAQLARHIEGGVKVLEHTAKPIMQGIIGTQCYGKIGDEMYRELLLNIMGLATNEINQIIIDFKKVTKVLE